MLQTIRKIGPVLDLFTVDCADWGVAEVASALGIPRSSAHAMLSSLADTGLLRTRGRGRYRVGWRVVELGETLRGDADLRAAARPVMRTLVQRFGDTVHLSVWDRTGGICVDRLLGPHPASITGMRVGMRFAPHSCAPGKLMMAFRAGVEPASEGAISAVALLRLTASTVTDPSVLAGQLARIRATGWAVDAGEAVPDVHSVAAPVRDEDGVLVAALSVLAPASRFLPRMPQLKRGVVEAAAQLSQRISAGPGRRPHRAGADQSHHGPVSIGLSRQRKPPA